MCHEQSRQGKLHHRCDKRWTFCELEKSLHSISSWCLRKYTVARECKSVFEIEALQLRCMTLSIEITYASFPEYVFISRCRGDLSFIMKALGISMESSGTFERGTEKMPACMFHRVLTRVKSFRGRSQLLMSVGHLDAWDFYPLLERKCPLNNATKMKMSGRFLSNLKNPLLPENAARTLIVNDSLPR